VFFPDGEFRRPRWLPFDLLSSRGTSGLWELDRDYFSRSLQISIVDAIAPIVTASKITWYKFIIAYPLNIDSLPKARQPTHSDGGIP
jgi:hypothetical protein